VAAYLVFGEVGPKQVLEELENKEIINVMDKIEVRINREFDRQFPEKALSQVEIFSTDGGHFISPVMQARGDFDYPLTVFLSLTIPLLGNEKSRELLQMMAFLEQVNNIKEFTNLLSHGG
jgi:2-methylcitrate dehydratase PrpD